MFSGLLAKIDLTQKGVILNDYRKIRNALEDILIYIEVEDSLDTEIKNSVFRLIDLVNEKVTRELNKFYNETEPPIISVLNRLSLKYGINKLREHFTYEDFRSLSKSYEDEVYESMDNYIKERLRNDNLSSE